MDYNSVGMAVNLFPFLVTVLPSLSLLFQSEFVPGIFSSVPAAAPPAAAAAEFNALQTVKIKLKLQRFTAANVFFVRWKMISLCDASI